MINVRRYLKSTSVYRGLSWYTWRDNMNTVEVHEYSKELRCRTERNVIEQCGCSIEL